MVIDAHCDTILKAAGEEGLFDLGERAHLDIKRLLGNVDLQIFAVFVSPRYRPFHVLYQGLQLIEKFHQEIEKNKKYINLVLTKKDLSAIGDGTKAAALLAVEGGDILAGDINILRLLYRLGVRSICLTWNNRNEIADGALDCCSGGGLTNFGLEVVKEMNQLGMVVDLSHISERGFWTALENAQAPLMVSHANCRKLQNHKRNLSDNQIKALAQKNGVMGITFVPDFLSGDQAGIEDVLKHIDYVSSLVGPDYVGLGSDFDGTDHLPVGLEDVCRIPQIAESLLKWGYSMTDVEKIMGKNFLRLFQHVISD
ncbi:MAG: dipeptidase [Desulfitobacteriaceae bacterium]|nr:dipeptidase [Desulfitobacteriaceae bacterium]MDD4752037.1 dipeptidase [Desulfitobacteriaceae bacterium]